MNLWLKKLKSGLAALSPTCREAVRAQSEMLDHPLPAGKRMGLWFHLLVCRWCRRYGKQIHLLHKQTRENQEALNTSSPQKLSVEARQRIKQKLQEEK
jgi:hypothetical protein